MIRASLEVEIGVEIARSPDEIWEFVSDPERLPEWLDEFTAVARKSDGPVGRGSVFQYTLEGDRSGTIELVDWVPGRRLAWDGPPLRWRGGGMRPRGSLEVSGAGDGHGRVVSRYQPELTGTMVFLHPILRRWLRRQRVADHQRLKQLLESGASS